MIQTASAPVRADRNFSGFQLQDTDRLRRKSFLISRELMFFIRTVWIVLFLFCFGLENSGSSFHMLLFPLRNLIRMNRIFPGGFRHGHFSVRHFNDSCF